MYICKRDGKGGYRVFEAAMHERVLERLELRAELQRAIEAGQFELHFQPVVRLRDGRVAGIEALVRWHHPTRGLVQPGQFIPLAEEMGLIVELGRWVLHEACQQAARLHASGEAGPDFTISVNLSVKQLQHPDVVADVRAALEASGIDPRMLVLEITETVLMADDELASRAPPSSSRTLGVRIAMDDFGTGYSSLSYLQPVPGRHPQDGPVVPRLRREPAGDGPRRRDRRARREPEARGRRRGHRAARASTRRSATSAATSARAS